MRGFWIAFYCLLGGLVLILLYYLKQFLGGWFEKITPSINVDSTKKGSVSNLFYNEKLFIHSKSELQNMSDLLFSAMSDFGTDEMSIVKILWSINSEEFNYIYNYYGKKDYSLYVGQVGWSWLDSMVGQKADLATWLKSEVSADLYSKIKSRFIKSKVVFP